MQFALVHSLNQVGVNPKLTSISIGGAIPRWMGKMSLVVRRSLCVLCTEEQTTFLTSADPHLSTNTQFALVHSLHQVGVNPEFASISIGGAIPRWLGKMSWKPVEICALFAPRKKPHF